MARSEAVHAVWTIALALVLAAAGVARSETTGTGWRLFSPCEGNCAIAVYSGPYVETSMADIFYKDPQLPFSWEYTGSDGLVGAALSRTMGTVWRIDVEAEVGLGQRIGRQDATEAWGAFFFRYRGFPWDRYVTTSFALSSGFNYASKVTRVERERAQDDRGARLHHYFAPEITLALPDRPNVELMFRLHHRSGVYGLVNDAHGGAQYSAIGLRFRF